MMTEFSFFSGLSLKWCIPVPVNHVKTHSHRLSRPPWAESLMIVEIPPCSSTDWTITAKSPDKMMPTWNTSVHTTAFRPPCQGKGTVIYDAHLSKYTLYKHTMPILTSVATLLKIKILYWFYEEPWTSMEPFKCRKGSLDFLNVLQNGSSMRSLQKHPFGTFIFKSVLYHFNTAGILKLFCPYNLYIFTQLK